MDLPFEKVEEALRAALRARLKPRGYHAFDRRIGKGEAGWTSKFLRGERPLSLETLLVVLVHLDLHPADFFDQAFPRSTAERVTQEYLGEFERQMREIAREVYREMDEAKD